MALSDNSDLLQMIAEMVEAGKVDINSVHPKSLFGKEGVLEYIGSALNSGIAPAVVLKSGLIEGMNRIGVRFRENKVFVPDVLIAAKAFKSGLKLLSPHFENNSITYKDTIIIGTVKGDLHDIGKNIVSLFFQGAGYKVIDLGVDVSTETFINSIQLHSPKAICLSALLTTTMIKMEAIIKSIKEIDSSTKILVGGAPLTKSFANSINADYFSQNPQDAVAYVDGI